MYRLVLAVLVRAFGHLALLLARTLVLLGKRVDEDRHEEVHHDEETDEEIIDFIAREGESAYPPSCTCRMGTDDMAVTDPALKVHGIEGLRVVDASVMPAVTNGNIYAPVLMIAEKAADLILGKAPLEPLQVPFYQHEPSEER